MSRTIISLTTLPGRIGQLAPVLRSLEEQTVTPNAIVVNIPYRLKRSGEGYRIPNWLHRHPLVHIHRCEDYGPATKVLGALQVETDPESTIISVDDDFIYPPEMIETYRRYLGAYGPHVYCVSGFTILDPALYAQDVRRGRRFEKGHLKQVQVVEGYASVAYPRACFSDDIYELQQWPECLIYSDDLLLSNYLSAQGTIKFTVATDAFSGARSFDARATPSGEDRFALHRNEQSIGSNRERYAESIRYLLDTGQYWLDSDESASC